MSYSVNFGEVLLAGQKPAGSKLLRAYKKLESKDEITLDMPGAPAVVQAKPGSWTTKELIKEANEFAERAFNWVSNTAMPFIAQANKQREEDGEAVLMAVCDDDTDKTVGDRIGEYEKKAEELLGYSPCNNAIFADELENRPKQEGFLNLLCMRVRHAVKLGMTIYDINHAGSMAELQLLLEESTDSAEDDARKIFTSVSGKNAPIRVCGKLWDLLDDAFGDLHKFAKEKLIGSVNGRDRELSKAKVADDQKKMAKISAPTTDAKETRVDPEDLFFGDPEKVNGCASVLKWTFGKSKNALVLCREDDVIYIDEAVGGPFEALETMRKGWKDPFVVLTRILSKDGQHLCPEDGQGKYDFGGYVKLETFVMTRWVRTAAGACIPSRLLPKEENGKKPSIVKEPGEFLTDREFLYLHGFGEYDLVFEPGFHYEPRDEQGNSIAKTFQITERAVARLERKQQVGGKSKIALKSASTEELFSLLEAGGALVDHEFFEGTKGSSLPTPLYLGIGQAFSRLKKSET